MVVGILKSKKVIGIKLFLEATCFWYSKPNMSDMINNLKSHEGPPMHSLPIIEQQLENDAVLREYAENNLKAENVQLRQDLETLSLKYTEKQISYIELAELVHELQHDNMQFAEFFTFKKCMILSSVNTALKNSIKYHKLKIFETVFADYADDKELKVFMKMADANLKMMINNKFGGEVVRRKEIIAKHYCTKFDRVKRHNKRKFERQFIMQNFSHHMSVQVMKSWCFNVLRDICIRAQMQDNNFVNILDVFQELEIKCQHMMKKVGKKVDTALENSHIHNISTI